MAVIAVRVKISIEIDFLSIEATHLTGEAFRAHGHLVAVRVHRGHNVNSGRVDETSDELGLAIVVAQVDRQRDEQLAAEYLVAVHVAHVLELGL